MESFVGKELFLRDSRGVLNGCLDVSFSQPWIFFENLGARHAICEAVEDYRDHNPCAFDAHLAVTNIGINAEAIQPGGFHVI